MKKSLSVALALLFLTFSAAGFCLAETPVDKGFLDRFHVHRNVAPDIKSGGFSLGKNSEIVGGRISGKDFGNASAMATPYIGLGITF